MNEEGADSSSDTVVLGELRALRKRSDGASVGGVAASPAVCQLLGNGDPLVAWNRLQHLALEVEWSQDIEAACYSLGFASTARTHLGRLEEFAATSFVDQRQARRYSDRGLIQLTRLITSNWMVHAVPTCDVVVNMTSPTTCDVYASWSHPETVKMAEMRFHAISASGMQNLQVELVSEQRSGRYRSRVVHPLNVDIDGETSVVVQWAGEVWPKFSAQLTGAWPEIEPVVECLGTKMMIRCFPVNAIHSQAEHAADDSDQWSIDSRHGDEQS